MQSYQSERKKANRNSCQETMDEKNQWVFESAVLSIHNQQWIKLDSDVFPFCFHMVIMFLRSSLEKNVLTCDAQTTVERQTKRETRKKSKCLLVLFPFRLFYVNLLNSRKKKRKSIQTETILSFPISSRYSMFFGYSLIYRSDESASNERIINITEVVHTQFIKWRMKNFFWHWSKKRSRIYFHLIDDYSNIESHLYQFETKEEWIRSDQRSTSKCLEIGERNNMERNQSFF